MRNHTPLAPPQAQLDAVFNAAVDHHEQGRIVEALEILQLLSLLDPRDEGVWRALARCHEEMGQPDVAEFLRALGAQIHQLDEEEPS